MNLNDSRRSKMTQIFETVTVTSNISTTLTIWNTSQTGTSLTVRVPYGVQYTVSGGDVANYTKSGGGTFTASQPTRSVSVTYSLLYEKVTVTSNVACTIYIGSHTSSANVTSFTANIPYGTSYWVSCSKVEGYNQPNGQSFTAGQTTRSVTLNHVYNPYNNRSYRDLGLPSGTIWYYNWEGTGINSGRHFKYGMLNSYEGDGEVYSSDYYTGTENPLSLSKDLARQKLGGLWHLPTKEQWQELIDNTNCSLVIEGSYGNYVGNSYVSKINNKSIYMEYLGYVDSSGINGMTFYTDVCTFWLSSTPNGSDACYVHNQYGLSSRSVTSVKRNVYCVGMGVIG